MIPFDWSFKEIADNDSYISMLLNYTDSTPLADTEISLTSVDAQHLCSNTSSVLDTHGGLLNCSLCVHAAYEVSSYEKTKAKMLMS